MSFFLCVAFNIKICHIETVKSYMMNSLYIRYCGNVMLENDLHIVTTSLKSVKNFE